MKNIRFLVILSLSLLFFVSGCGSEAESTSKNHGSSITTEPPGVAPTLQSGNSGSSINNGNIEGTQTKEETGSSDDNLQPHLQLTTQNPKTDPLFEPYLQDLNNLLEGFDILNEQVDETFEKYLEYPDSSKSFSDYTTILGYLVEHLRSVEGFSPPEDLLGLHQDFVGASLALGERYEKVAELMNVGFSAETQEELEEFEDLTGEIVAVTDDFTSTAFALLGAME